MKPQRQQHCGGRDSSDDEDWLVGWLVIGWLLVVSAHTRKKFVSFELLIKYTLVQLKRLLSQTVYFK
jgi:hypothetical protein